MTEEEKAEALLPIIDAAVRLGFVCNLLPRKGNEFELRCGKGPPTVVNMLNSIYICEIVGTVEEDRSFTFTSRWKCEVVRTGDRLTVYSTSHKGNSTTSFVELYQEVLKNYANELNSLASIAIEQSLTCQ